MVLSSVFSGSNEGLLLIFQSLDAFLCDFIGDCIQYCATTLRFSSVQTDVDVPERGSSA